MNSHPHPQPRETRQRRYLVLVVLGLLVVSAAVIAHQCWPAIMAQLARREVWPTPSLTAVPPSPPPTVSLTPVPPTATPTISQPIIVDLGAQVDEEGQTIVFHLEAAVPPDHHIAEAILWYDTQAGHELRRFPGPLPPSTTLEYKLDAASEGLTTTLSLPAAGTPVPDMGDGISLAGLDYWWLVRDSSGDSVRAGDTALLSPAWQELVTTPTPLPPPIDFAWTVSESEHFLFHYVSGSAAERDLSQLSALAEAALDRTSATLELDFDDQMTIYFVPRVFWQGGAAYGDKVQLISYLDRNYTGVETWSYFTHEGTHALAQDLLQPKEEGGGPDGVLVEGLAVWASGGHYRLEPLDAWAAALAASDEYIALEDLRTGSFYDFQHETSYLEGASFVKFLIERYGLEKLKELYGLATGDMAKDEDLVQRLYGQSYEELEANWLHHLASLAPSPEQAEMWRLTTRSFDLMRRYETELDPDARILPESPTAWTTDTLEIFLHRVNAPLNMVLETALIAAQERMQGGDLAGAEALLNDVEAALDAGGVLNRSTLLARQAILELVADQDRAILRADASAYLETLHPASPLAAGHAVEERLTPPLTDYQQEIVRLDVADSDPGRVDRRAEGMVLVHSQAVDGKSANDGLLFSVTFATVGDRWLMVDLQPFPSTGKEGIALPPLQWGIGQ